METVFGISIRGSVFNSRVQMTTTRECNYPVNAWETYSSRIVEITAVTAAVPNDFPRPVAEDLLPLPVQRAHLPKKSQNRSSKKTRIPDFVRSLRRTAEAEIVIPKS